MIKLKDLIPENRKQINEFDLKGKIHTSLQLYLDGLETDFMNYYVPESSKLSVKKKILEVMSKIAKNYNGNLTDKKYLGRTDLPSDTRPVIIEWDRQMDESEFDKVYNELKTEIEKVFNTNLFQFYVNGFLFKGTGVMGTPISKGNITKWFTKEYNYYNRSGSSFGEGDRYQKEYLLYLKNLKKTRSEFFNEKIQGKLSNLLYTYFTDNPSVIFKKTDWLKDVRLQTEKLFDTFKVDEPTVISWKPKGEEEKYSSWRDVEEFM